MVSNYCRPGLGQQLILEKISIGGAPNIGRDAHTMFIFQWARYRRIIPASEKPAI